MRLYHSVSVFVCQQHHSAVGLRAAPTQHQHSLHHLTKHTHKGLQISRNYLLCPAHLQPLAVWAVRSFHTIPGIPRVRPCVSSLSPPPPPHPTLRSHLCYRFLHLVMLQMQALLVMDPILWPSSPMPSCVRVHCMCVAAASSWRLWVCGFTSEDGDYRPKLSNWRASVSFQESTRSRSAIKAVTQGRFSAAKPGEGGQGRGKKHEREGCESLMTPHFVPCNHRSHSPRTRTFPEEPGNFNWVSRYLHPPKPPFITAKQKAEKVM